MPRAWLPPPTLQDTERSYPCPATAGSVGGLSRSQARRTVTACWWGRPGGHAVCGNLCFCVSERPPPHTRPGPASGDSSHCPPSANLFLTSAGDCAEHRETQSSRETPGSPAHLYEAGLPGAWALAAGGQQAGSLQKERPSGTFPRDPGIQIPKIPPVPWASQQGQGPGSQAAGRRLETLPDTTSGCAVAVAGRQGGRGSQRPRPWPVPRPGLPSRTRAPRSEQGFRIKAPAVPAFRLRWGPGPRGPCERRHGPDEGGRAGRPPGRRPVRRRTRPRAAACAPCCPGCWRQRWPPAGA